LVERRRQARTDDIHQQNDHIGQRHSRATKDRHHALRSARLDRDRHDPHSFEIRDRARVFGHKHRPGSAAGIIGQGRTIVISPWSWVIGTDAETSVYWTRQDCRLRHDFAAPPPQRRRSLSTLCEGGARGGGQRPISHSAFKGWRVVSDRSATVLSKGGGGGQRPISHSAFKGAGVVNDRSAKAPSNGYGRGSASTQSAVSITRFRGQNADGFVAKLTFPCRRLG
jgi:hypothetical protein